MKIAIVNDMNLAVETLRRAVCRQPENEIIWVARDGEEAVLQCRGQRPDLILMDLIMPVMDGVEATRRIMAENPCAILIVTATVEGNSSKVYEAMGHGALDAVATPTLQPSGDLDGSESLLRKINLIHSLIRDKVPTPLLETTHLPKRNEPQTTPLLAIGASTGGPQAVARIISGLPHDFSAAIVLVQHVDQLFAAGLAAWLQERCAIPADIIHNGTTPKPGTIWVAATNDHLVMRPDGLLGYTPYPKSGSYRPSIDVFFQSVAEYWRGRVCGILLTGMGRDGAEGLLTMRKAGFQTIAQDKETSIVYGMPKAAAELNAAELILPLSEISQAVNRYFPLSTPPES